MKVPTERPTRPPRPIPLPVIADNIPAELKTFRQWIVWRYTWVDKNGKWDKPPYQAIASKLKYASSTDPTTWDDFGAALAVYEGATNTDGTRRYDGLGFVFTNMDGLVGIDLDDCRDPETGEFTGAARWYLKQLDSYTEVSPSGTGAKVWARGCLPDDDASRLDYSTGARRGGRNVRPYEMYEYDHYFTVTGNHLEGSPTAIEEREKAIQDVYWLMFPPKEDNPFHEEGGLPRSLPELTDQEVIDRCLAARFGDKFRALMSGDTSFHNGDDSRADLALLTYLTAYTRDPDQMERIMSDSELGSREKWRRRADYPRRTIDKALSSGFAMSAARWQEKMAAFESEAADAVDYEYGDDCGDDVAECPICHGGAVVTELKHALWLKDLELKARDNIHLRQEVRTVSNASKRLKKRDEAAGAGENMWHELPIWEVARSLGISPHTASTHLRKGEEIGVLEMRQTRVRDPDDPRKMRTVTHVRAKQPSYEDSLRVIAEYKPPAGSPARKWGGERVMCSEHPNADVIEKKVKTCSVCHKVLEVRSRTIKATDPPDGDENTEDRVLRVV